MDPDAPDPEEPTARSILHWLVVDIPGRAAADDEDDAAAAGHTVVPYRKPTPPVGTHRYIFLLFPQRGGARGEAKAKRAAPAERGSFSVRGFVAEQRLGELAGAAFFRAAKHTKADEHILRHSARRHRSE